MTKVVPIKQVVGTIVATGFKSRSSRKGIPNHPVEFKRKLAAAACQPDVSVAKLALAHGINANLLFKWRRYYRAGRYDDQAVQLLPVTLEPSERANRAGGPAQEVALAPQRDSGRSGATQATAAELEIRIAAAVIRVRGEVNPATLRVVVDTLARYR